MNGHETAQQLSTSLPADAESKRLQLVKVSNRYGANPDWVLAGGGNTSVKAGRWMFIKASGTTLATITADGFACMDRDRLEDIWTTAYPADQAKRESQALTDLMNARAPWDREKRPSVETLMHHLLPATFVVHTHPPLINGVTCGRDGRAWVEHRWPDQALWVPTVNPGYILATTIRAAVNDFIAKVGHAPALIFLENHGLVVSADTVARIDELHTEVRTALLAAVVRHPRLGLPAGTAESDVAQRSGWVQTAVRRADAAHVAAGAAEPIAVHVLCTAEAVAAAGTAAGGPTTAAGLQSAYSPDHIVYAGVAPLLVQCDEPTESAIGTAVFAALQDYFAAHDGRRPKSLLVSFLGAVGIGAGGKVAATAAELLTDAVKVSVYSESFGGPRFLPQDQIDFILNWEVEHYRAKVGSGG